MSYKYMLHSSQEVIYIGKILTNALRALVNNPFKKDFMGKEKKLYAYIYIFLKK